MPVSVLEGLVADGAVDGPLHAVHRLEVAAVLKRKRGQCVRRSLPEYSEGRVFKENLISCDISYRLFKVVPFLILSVYPLIWIVYQVCPFSVYRQIIQRKRLFLMMYHTPYKLNLWIVFSPNYRVRFNKCKE